LHRSTPVRGRDGEIGERAKGAAMYERIVVPLDGSDGAETVLPFAEKIAGPLDAELVLVRVVEPIATAVALGSGEVGGLDALLYHQTEAKRYLAEMAERLTAKGLRVRTLVALGAPVGEIVAAAEAENADLIAMTTHGRTGVRRLVFGSVAEGVLRAAAVPLLMFRMPAPAAPAASGPRMP
jgi:nucleotide-binding universal stress UspA family protein